MAVQVRILPSGHQFISEGNSNLLEAGLRAGLALGYGCSNGNCGKCMAKIVSGEVTKTKHHDFRLSPGEKAGGHVLMCCNSAVSDVVLEAPEAHNAAEIPQQQLTARVRDITIVNGDVALLHLKTPRTSRLRFLAGQHVRLGGNDMPAASHSVGSCPCDDMHLHFQIPLLPGDGFSAYVFKQLKKGDAVGVTGPNGDFLLNEESPRSLVFIAWHTGFAPVRSLIEQAMALEVAASIQLVWLAPQQKDRYFDNLCRSWEDALDEFKYIPVDIESGDNITNINSLLFNILSTKHDNLIEYDYYISGTRSLLDAYGKILLSSGLPPAQLVMDSITHA